VTLRDFSAAWQAYLVPIFRYWNRIMFKTIAFASMLSACAAPAFAADPPVPPTAFAGLVPAAFPNGLTLVELRPRCDGCAPWREVGFHSGEAPAAVRQERVSVHDGVTAMYAFPGTAYFANVKVERSIAGRYEQDKAVVTEALAHECAWTQARVVDYAAGHPDAREKLARAVVKDKPYVELEQGGYRGIAYAACTQKALGLMGGAISQLQIFIPGRDTIVTAYLLVQKQAQFRTIEEFLRLRREFIEGYIDFLQPTPGSAG
jgi:hypothetical protein